MLNRQGSFSRKLIDISPLALALLCVLAVPIPTPFNFIMPPRRASAAAKPTKTESTDAPAAKSDKKPAAAATSKSNKPTFEAMITVSCSRCYAA